MKSPAAVRFALKWLLLPPALFGLPFSSSGLSQTPPVKTTWKSVQFAIVRYNDEAPKSWAMYHAEKKGLLLVRLWKRYLLVDLKEEEVYDIDPATVKPAGSDVEWSLADKPADAIDTEDWKERDVGLMHRVLFRLGKGGHMLDLQVPLMPNGKPAY